MPLTIRHALPEKTKEKILAGAYILDKYQKNGSLANLSQGLNSFLFKLQDRVYLDYHHLNYHLKKEIFIKKKNKMPTVVVTPEDRQSR